MLRTEPFQLSEVLLPQGCAARDPSANLCKFVDSSPRFSYRTQPLQFF
jgi:hypothetical protein